MAINEKFKSIKISSVYGHRMFECCYYCDCEVKVLCCEDILSEKVKLNRFSGDRKFAV